MKPFASQKGLVVLNGKPSKEVMNRKKEENKAFLEKRIKDLGPNGLADKAKILHDAKKSNLANTI